MYLVTNQAFGPHARGDHITDAATIASVQAEHPDKVVAVGGTSPLEPAAPAAPEPAPETPKESSPAAS